jgi:hypothetical protein
MGHGGAAESVDKMMEKKKRRRRRRRKEDDIPMFSLFGVIQKQVTIKCVVLSIKLIHNGG